MKIAYVSSYDSADVRNWSGLGRYIWESLAAQGAEIELIGPLSNGRSIRRRLHRLWGAKIEHKLYDYFWDPDTAKGFAEEASRRIDKSGADVILAPNPIPIAYMDRKEPIFLWTDSPFSGLLDFYPEFSRERLSRASVKAGLAIDQATFDRCTLAIFSSDWAAQSAIQNHSVSPDKIKVVPFGANIHESPSYSQVTAMIDQRSRECLRLLFMGVDWERKGGATALAAAQALHDRGVNVELTVVGCDPPGTESLPGFVRCLGFIGKDTTEGRTTLNNLFAESHVLIVPSQAECYGLVFVEAHAFGVPCAATGVGGIPTIVKDGVTGRLFNLDESPEKWADWLQQIFNDPDLYRKFALAAYERYHGQLNWNVAGLEVSRLIQERLSSSLSARG